MSWGLSEIECLFVPAAWGERGETGLEPADDGRCQSHACRVHKASDSEAVLMLRWSQERSQRDASLGHPLSTDV
jgi:hypothetical protein